MGAAIRCDIVEVELAKVRAVSDIQSDDVGAICSGS